MSSTGQMASCKRSGLASVSQLKPLFHMPLYWLCYCHNNQISVVIEPGASIIHARMRAALAEFNRRPNRRRITPATTK